MSYRSSHKDGDWICSDEKCANVNFSRRTKCNRCGKDKEIVFSKKGGVEIGKNLAEKSKGLFSPDDWQCKTCGNVNWARRTTCNVCNAPKFGKIEQRTGYGGGFMERDEVVEYNRRDDSDNEYDEFGRKKKKFRGLSAAKPKESENGRPAAESYDQNDEVEEEVEEEVDDEEEDDDDVDLSKYALDSDDDDKEEKSQRSSSSSSESRSRSQSRSSSSSRSRGKRSYSRSRSRSSSRGRKRRARRSRSYSSSSRSSSERSRSRSRSKNF